jgi:DNA-binding SARP family transcriptional activator/tetratricopeptide (TPR) repeat protein
MAGLKVMLLGGFEARLASGAPLSLPTKKAQALLAYLGLRPGQNHPRDKLAALLWGEKSDEQARGGLRHALVALRRALAGATPAALRIEGQTLALDPVGVEVDVVSFERQIAEGTPRALEHAAELYRGDLLLGFNLNEPLFEEWLVAERERLREMALDALARLLTEQTRAAATERAIQTAVRLLGLDPLQEAAHRTLMRLYARQGRRGAALKQYQVCVGVLQRELGTAPEAETKNLYQDLLRRPTQVMPASDAQEGHRSHPARTVGPAPPALPTAETPLFGRQAELGRLRQRLDEAIRGQGQIAAVVGEAGIGKTRLVSTLAADALSRGCRVLIGHCHESDSILPFGPWVDACRSGQVSADEEILGALHPTRRAEVARLLPEAGMAGLPRASNGALPLFESVAQLIEQAAACQPLVLVLEDLHWADEMSLRLLAFVSRRIPAWPALLITTAREEELAEASPARRTLEELSRAPQAMLVGLSPLSRPDTALLVRALIRVGSDAPTVAQVEERIWAMSEGNPFVAVEAMRALDETSLWDGARDLRAPALPASVRDLVARRLDRLSARTQQVTAVAAVIGRRFDFALLQSASGVDERDAAEAVEEMVRHHVLQAVGNQLEFTHDRVREVASGRLLPPRRRLLHRAVAGALEAGGAGIVDAMDTLHRDRLDEHIEELAHHAVRGGLREKAVEYLRRAGLKAAARSALQDARAWFEQALGALEELPESQGTLEEAFEIRLSLRSVLGQLGEFRRVLELLREAGALAERLNDEGRRGWVCAFMTNVHSRLDEPDEAVVSGRRALEIARCLGDLRLRILATAYLEQAHYYRGEYARVVELATDNIRALPRDWVHEFFGSNQPPSVHDRARLALSFAHLGRFAEAAEYEAEAIRLAEATHHAYTVALAYHAASTLYLVKGDWAKAHSLTERQIAVLRAGNIVGELPSALADSARALAYLGEASEALNRLRESEQLLEGQLARGRTGNGWVYYSLGRACLRLGRLDEARRLADRAVESGSRRIDFVPDALQLLGDIAIHPDRVQAESGETYYRKALALAEPRGMRPLVAHCYLGLGKLYARTGKQPEAREHLTTATTMYREMDVRFWLEQAEAETDALRSPEVEGDAPCGRGVSLRGAFTRSVPRR